MASIAATKEVLRKRVRRLLRLDRPKNDRSELRARILPCLQSLGEVALIGGAIRDLARSGRSAFASDLDFVVYGSPPNRFRDVMVSMNAKANRFGGYAVQFQGWKVDVWHLEDTWARTAGLRRVEQISDLLKCTFFDWDSVVFDLRTGELIFDEDYLFRLSIGVMNVRLSENPNPDGSLVRALRRAALWNVRFGWELTEFSLHHLEKRDWEDLVERDRSAFPDAILSHLDRADLVRKLEDVDTVAGVVSSFPIRDWGWQQTLPLPRTDRTILSPVG